MYCQVCGEGDPVLLIHGGSATLESFFNQIPALAENHKVIAADSRGHGRTPDTDAPLTYESMASDFIALLDGLKIDRVRVVGWSDGGVIGLHLAMHHPDRVERVVAIGAATHVDGLTEEYLAAVNHATPDDHPEMLVEQYKALSPDGPEHWPVIYGKLKEMWSSSPTWSSEDLSRIACPVLLMLGDRDIVRLDHAAEALDALAQAQLCVIPGATHFVPVEKPDLVNRIILDFLDASAPEETA